MRRGATIQERSMPPTNVQLLKDLGNPFSYCQRMGIDSFEGRNSSHQKKKMALEDLIAYRDSLKLPTDDDVENAPSYHPGEDSDEIEYLRSKEALGDISHLGGLPGRHQGSRGPTFSEFDEGTREGLLVSTTMVFVRLLRKPLEV